MKQHSSNPSNPNPSVKPIADFSKIDRPDENLVFDLEVKKKIADTFARVHIDYIGLIDGDRKQRFLGRLAKSLSVEEVELTDAIGDKSKLAALFLRLKDAELTKFNSDKDGWSALAPDDLTEASIQQYCNSIDFRGVMAIDDGKSQKVRISNYNKGSQEDPGNRSFATHSVSKLIAGVTMCKMIVQGVIPEGALDSPLELSDEVKAKLPQKVRTHITKHQVTLRDVMTHHSGLGNYLDPEIDPDGQPGKLGYGINGYSGYVRRQLEQGLKVEVPKSTQDYLQYAETRTYDYGKRRYSDLGIMLASLSAEHHYNKTKNPSEHKSFEKIVEEQLIGPAGVEQFSAQRPENAICHSDDPIASYITGTAGCGYWTTLDDLVKIGRYVHGMWHEDERFRDVVKDCGQEFYDEQKQLIDHPGGIDSSETLLSVDLKSGTVVAMEERRLGEKFGYRSPAGWGVMTAATKLDRTRQEEHDQLATQQSAVALDSEKSVAQHGADLVHSKTMDELDGELGIGSHQDDPGAKEIRKSWAAKVSGKSAESPIRGI